jgi:glucose dehydrogenase
VFLPIGLASHDFYGATARGEPLRQLCRRVDAAIGRVRWYFQTVHHDPGTDVPAQPVLVTDG